MSEEGILFHGLAEYELEHVRPVRIEFDAVVTQGNVTTVIAQKYERALSKYGSLILEKPCSPGYLIIAPTAYDLALRKGAERKLAEIDSELLRILSYTGGALAVDRTEGESD